jgi:nucleoside-diphosphate-sugar epimerase
LPDLTRCVAFSSSSVHSKKTPEIIKLLEAESTVKEVLARRKIALCLLRPTMIWGCGMDQNVSLLRTIGEKTGFIPVSAEGGGLRQPVHADDLAAAASHAVLAAHPVRHEGEIGGGSRLTYREVVEKTARSGRRRVRVVALPPWTFRFLVKLARMAPRFRGLDPGMVDRQSIDLVFDDRETRTVLNVSPRAFEPVTADFSLPSRVARFQLPPSSAADT